MMYSYRSIVAIVATCVLVGCGSDSGSSGPQPDGSVQFVHAITNAPGLSIEIELDGEVMTLGVLEFQGATGSNTMARDTYTVSIQYQDPNSSVTTNLLTDVEFDVSSDTLHTIVIRGSFALPELLFLEKPLDPDFDSDTDIDEIELQVLNLSSSAAAVYIGDPGLGLSGDTLLGTVTFGSNTEPTLILDEDNSTYRLRVTGDSSATVVYDSGEFDIPARSRRLIVVNDNVGPDPETRTAFLVTEDGSTMFPNEVARSGLRIVNAVADEASAIVTITNPSTLEVIDSATLMFPDVTDFVTVDPTFINVSVELASSSGDLTNTTVSLNEDSYFTVVVGGSGFEDAISIRAARADLRPVATAASLQFINGLRVTDIEEFDRVDLYALPIGDSLADAAPVLGQIEFLGSGTGSLPATTIDLVVTTAGTQAILAGPIRVNIEGSTALLILATEGFGGGPPNQIIVHSAELN